MKQGSTLLRLAKWFSFAFTIVMLLVMFTPISNFMARPLIQKPELKRADIIAVLGGGAYRNGVLAGGSNERLIRGLVLLRRGYSDKIIFSGGAITGASKKIFHALIKPDGAGKIDAPEAELMKNISDTLGIPPGVSAVDASSSSTRENLIHINDYMKANNMKTCLLVTSPAHMLRASLVAKKLGMDVYPAQVDDYTALRTSTIDRLCLFYEAAWEYAGLALYKLYGYI